MHRTLDDARLNEYGAKLKTFSRVALAALCFIVALGFAAPAHAQTPTLTYTVETTTQGGKSVVPRLTWSTAPGGAVCVASTTPAAVPPATDPWSGAKATQGTMILPAITASRSYTMSCNWPGDSTATIGWIAPTTNTDTSPLAKCSSQTEVGTCLRSFLVVRGTSADTVGVDSKAVNDRNATSYVWTGLTPGTHWFSVVAVNGNDIQSDQFIPPKSKVITASASQVRSLEVLVRFPENPTGVTVQ